MPDRNRMDQIQSGILQYNALIHWILIPSVYDKKLFMILNWIALFWQLSRVVLNFEN